MSNSSDVKMQNTLDAVTVALQNGEDIDALLAQSAAARDDVDEFVAIIQALQSALIPQEVRPEFAAALRSDLLGERRGVVKRVRQMPARVQIAAIVALFAGCLLLLWRRILGSDVPQEIQEEAVATSH